MTVRLPGEKRPHLVLATQPGVPGGWNVGVFELDPDSPSADLWRLAEDRGLASWPGLELHAIPVAGKWESGE